MRYTIIAGAGISMSPPSNLPSWWQYNKAIVEIIKELAGELCPEASDLIAAIDIEKGLPVQCISEVIVRQGAGESYFGLLELLDAVSPNANHLSLVELARYRKLNAVITTNFDTLIETAFMQEAVPLFTIVRDEEYYELSQESVCKLFKIHGSVTDYASLVDTITQKATGLSPAKRFILSNILTDSEIIVIGFSGADLDFDLDYIPISQALENGNNVTWIIYPGSSPNNNIIELKKKYPDQISFCEKNLSDLFEELGVNYGEIHNRLSSTDSADEKNSDDYYVRMKTRIRELLMSPHIGMHGCVGYCISFLNMMGLTGYASELAEKYEKHIDLKKIDICSLVGLQALAVQKLKEQKYDECITYNLSIVKCLKYMERSCEKHSNEEEKRHQEFQANLASVTSNLALAYFYKKDLHSAENYFEKAKEHAIAAQDVRKLSLITFNLARVKYQKSNDCDKFLESLGVSAEYAQKTGALELLVEILLEECRIRLNIGEYYLARLILDKIEQYLKNIGNFNLHIRVKRSEAEYLLRIGEIKKSEDCFKQTINLVKEKGDIAYVRTLLVMAGEMYECNSDFWNSLDELCDFCGLDIHELKKWCEIQNKHEEGREKFLPAFIREKLPDDRVRQQIILCEYQKEKKYLAALFCELCIKYVQKENWKRLQDEGKCFYDAAEAGRNRSIALYYLGCADMERKNYSVAKKYFQEVIKLGDSADPHYRGWANIELAKMEVEGNNIDVSMQYYNKAKNELCSCSDRNEMVNACIVYVQHLFSNGYPEKACGCAESLLKETNDPDIRERITKIIDRFVSAERKGEDKEKLDVEKDPPQKIANEALRIYDEEKDPVYAWKLIRIAKEKYEKRGDIEGIGRCENNIASFLLAEGKIEEAILHCEKTMHVKEKSGYTQGVINQLLNIIFLYKTIPDQQSMGKYIDYALLHMPEYENCIEKYKLFLGLHVYYISNLQYAEALYFAKRAYEGLEYLPEISTLSKEKNRLIETIHAIECSFKQHPMQELDDNHFSHRVLEAIRMYKKGEFDNCCVLLDQLCKEVQSDYFRLGIVKGTYGNAYLYVKKYQNAIRKFNEARVLFSNVKEAEKAQAAEHVCTAINGIVQALDHLGRGEEAITILRNELSRSEVPEKSRFAYTISLCNRLINNNQDNIVKDDSLFLKILEMLNVWKNKSKLSHEEKGVMYSTIGLLYLAAFEKTDAEKYYKLAKKEFLITNSMHLKEIEMILQSIDEESFE